MVTTNSQIQIDTSKVFDVLKELHTPTNELIGQRLKEERVKNKLTQTELAEIGGVTKNTQFNYEQGKRSPNVEYLFLISTDVDVNYIITGISIFEHQKRALNNYTKKINTKFEEIRLILDRTKNSHIPGKLKSFKKNVKQFFLIVSSNLSEPEIVSLLKLNIKK